ncbi:kinase-like protein [Aspergillus sclerotioniger CBS 115572]|uniref:Kinase-like protein n=1 Tax=Aspergillus sclerotioniger CBS 115572 TaxID=1450535 RepID=A0A317WYC1_9EURO|nr:kinase-like protein [Aspergillus sclerotioniger CBS 115572]PWY90332.1 kinase-like protein [Aspergillus sclerotioniger CBS 115572]
MANETDISHPAKLDLLSIRLWIGKRLYGRVGRLGVRISPRKIIKGPCEITELAALNYVAEHTSIPVPKILNVYHHRDGLYIKLTYVSGMDLQAAWLGGHLSQDQKKHIIAEVIGYVNQFRSLDPPCKGIVGSADLQVCLDHRVRPLTFGPFNEHEAFHSFLRRHIILENCTKTFGEEVTDCHSRHYRSCFTHADLCPRNIIVDKGKVSAIIDWEFGGWYPEYWEYTKAHFGQIEMPEWYEGLEFAMARYDVEMRAERALWKQCDQPGMPL